MFETLGNALIQLLVGLISASAGAAVTHLLERSKRRKLEQRRVMLEDEIRQVANQPDAQNGQQDKDEIRLMTELPARQGGQRSRWSWEEIVPILRDQVTPGKVTTYPLLSLLLYRRVLNQPVGALLAGASHHGHQVLTNRVVKKNGSLADLPEGAEQQRKQLESEGIPFTVDGRVDWSRTQPVVLV